MGEAYGVGGIRRPDLAGLTILAREGVVEDAGADIVHLRVSADPLAPGAPEWVEDRFSGTWHSGMLVAEDDVTGRRIRIAADALVTIVPGWEPDGHGNATRFGVSGRCLARDEPLMRARLTATLMSHVAAMRSGYAAISDAMGTGGGEWRAASPVRHGIEVRTEGFHGTRHALETRLPPGRYWVGDPCKAMARERYLRLLRTGEGTRRVEVDGGIVCVTSTANGDGIHHADRGRCMVESGQIGILSSYLVDAGKDPSRWGIDLDCPAGILVGLDRGRHAFGIVGPDGSHDWMDVVDDPALLDF